MMKVLFGLFLDASVASALILWARTGDERLLNIGYFVFWFIGVCVLIAYLSKSVTEKMEKDYTHQPVIWRVYDIMTDFAIVIFSAWSGWFVLAAVYGTGAALKAAFISNQEKQLSEQALQR